MQRLKEHGGEFIAHGWNMDHLHYGGQPLEEEAELVQRSVNTLRQVTGQPVRGWLSPAKHQSFNTLDLLAENGLEYCADWVNDDLPYACATHTGHLTMMPLATEIEDQFVMSQNLHSEDSRATQVKDAFDFLLEESREQGGRLFALNLHPGWWANLIASPAWKTCWHTSAGMPTYGRPRRARFWMPSTKLRSKRNGDTSLFTQ